MLIDKKALVINKYLTEIFASTQYFIMSGTDSFKKSKHIKGKNEIHFLPLCCCIVFLIAVQVKSAEPKWNNFINRQYISCLFPDGEYLWIGTRDAGLVRRNIKTGEELVFDKDEGFFSDQINCIVRDSNNVIWAASPYEIACFQNGSWVVKKLFDNTVGDLTIDSSGHLWVACTNGIGRYTGDQFVKITTFDSLKKSDEYPMAIVGGKEKNIVYTLVKKRIICCTGDGLQFQSIDIPLGNPLDICIGRGNRLFVAGVDTVGMYTDNQWSFFSVNDSSLSSTVMKLSTSPQGDVWACGGGDVSAFSENKWIIQHKYSFGSGIISTVAPLSENSAWFGRAFFLAFKTPYELNTVLPNAPGGNFIRFIFADKEGTIWAQAADDDNGIMQFIDGKWKFNELFYTLGNRTIKMLHTSDSVYWFLQPRNCLNYLLKINGWPQRYITGSSFIPSGSLNDFIEDASGNIWFATSEGVISNQEEKLYNSQNAGFPSNNIKCLLLRKNSTVWIGGNNGTIAFYKDSTWTIQSISTDSHITSLAEDSSGNLWIGTNNGLIKKTEAKETVFTISDGLGHNIVNTVFVDNNNRVWVGTHNGLSCFEDGVLKQTYLRPYGIAGNYISSICQNKDDVLWIGTDRGISTLTLGTPVIKPDKSKERYSMSKNSPHSILNIGSNSRKIPASADTYLLNGKKGSSPTKQLPLRAVNCYIVK